MPATSYTINLTPSSSGGHQKSPATWTIELIGGDFVGTITGTPGGGLSQCQIYLPVTVAFTGDGTLSKPFTFTPLSVDTVVFTFSNSGGLINPTPQSYLAIGQYLMDTFAGAAGTPIQDHTSDMLPSGLAGSGWDTPFIG